MKTLRERLLGRLVIDPSGCLLWTGCKNSRGYGVIGVNGKRELVHRVAWQLEHGPIPAGLTIDHVHDRGCRHKHCGNIAHLEPVTIAENIRRSWRSNPCRPSRPRPAREPWSPPDGYWQRFAEWAGPEEWADLAPEDRERALASISP